MENVVYFLGAGFPAPLGIPTMQIFLDRAKDMYYEKPDQFPNFSGVFEAIKKLSFAKNYYHTDLFNIEEILSILEMQMSFENQDLIKIFDEFICSVVKYYTPPVQTQHTAPSQWLFDNVIWARYSLFVCSLFGTLFAVRPSGDSRINYRIEVKKQIDEIPKYSIITTNYDMVLEQICTFINNTYSRHTNSDQIAFAANDECWEGKFNLLAKLHGSVKDGDIIPPTWNKTLHKSVSNTWSLSLSRTFRSEPY